MTSEAEKDKTNDSEEDAATKLKLELDGRGVDWFLQKLVTMINVSDDLELGITLHVEGATISGTIISAPKYFNEFAVVFLGDPKPDTDTWFRDWIISHGDIYKVEDADTQLPPPNYLHLRNAQVHSAAGPVPTNAGVLWRGKISAVSGFNFGLLSTEAP